MEDDIKVCYKGKVLGVIHSDVYEFILDEFFNDKPVFSESRSITFSELKNISRKNNFNYALFFARLEQLEKLAKIRNEEIYGKFDGNYVLGTRGEKIDIKKISLLISSLISRQAVYKEYGNNVRLDKIVKYLSSSKQTIEEQSEYIISTLKLSMPELRSKGDKRTAFKFLRDELSKSFIHTTVEVNNYMPMNLPDDFHTSGFILRDNFNPIIFIANEASNHPDENTGRKIYTTIMMTVALFKGVSYVVNVSGDNFSVDDKNFKEKNIYEITNQILLPADEVKRLNISTYDELSRYANEYKVTPKCLLYRAHQLNNIPNYKELKDECSKRFRESVKQKLKGGPTPKIMVPYFQGSFIELIKNKIPTRELQKKVFDKHVSYSRLNIRFEDFL